MTQDKNAFVVYVFGNYDKYIPYYIYFINLNYPNDDILIFCQDKVSESVSKALVGLKNYKLFENVLPEHKGISGGGPKLLRWVLPREYFDGYKYIYIGDVDILMLKEAQSLFDFHKNQMKQFGLPFSNRVRPLPEGGLSKRLTGLHFFEVDPYYDKIESTAIKILTDQDFSNAYLKGLERNEHVLYKLVKDCIGFDENEVVKMERPWHGFHIGVVRGGLKMTRAQIEANSSISPEEIKKQLSVALRDPAFVKLFKTSFCVEAYWSYQQFDIKLPIDLKLALLKFNVNRVRQKIKRKILG